MSSNKRPKHALWPPARATYSISGWLGSGTFGAVFKARRRSTHDSRSRSSSVAVKVIPRYSYASSRELEVMQILREKPHVAVMQLIECFSVASTQGSAACILTCLVLPLYDSCLSTTKTSPTSPTWPASARPERLVVRGWLESLGRPEVRSGLLREKPLPRATFLWS